MCGIVPIMAGASLAMGAAGTYMSYQGAKQQAESQQTAAYYGAYQSEQQAVYAEQEAEIQDVNEGYSQADAEEVLRVGAMEESKVRRNVEKIKGQQLVGMAGANIDLSSGSAVRVLTETARLGEIDAMTLRGNYVRESQGFQRAAWNSANEAYMLRADATAYDIDAAYQRQTGQQINPTASALSAGLAGASSTINQGYNFYRYGAFNSLIGET